MSQINAPKTEGTNFPGLHDIYIPEVLQASVDRHRANLARLVKNLQSAGSDRSQIEASINAVVASYRLELLAVLHTFMKSPDNVGQ